MIIITGATGALNGATASQLLERIPADQIGVSVRDVARAQPLADRGVRVRRGSYDDPAAPARLIRRCHPGAACLVQRSPR